MHSPLQASLPFRPLAPRSLLAGDLHAAFSALRLLLLPGRLLGGTRTAALPVAQRHLFVWKSVYVLGFGNPKPNPMWLGRGDTCIASLCCDWKLLYFWKARIQNVCMARAAAPPAAWRCLFVCLKECVHCMNTLPVQQRFSADP